MKRLALPLLAVVLSSAQAQVTPTAASAPQVVPCDRSVTIGYHLPDPRWGPKNSFTAFITTPAIFPNPEKLDFINADFTMDCRGISARSTVNSLELSGPLSASLQLLRAPWIENRGLINAIPGKIVIAFEGDYVYPSIRENWYQERVFFTLENGRLAFKHEGSDYEMLKDLVIGARVNGGALQPLFFQGKLTPITHEGDDLLELYVKGERRAFDYMALNFGKGIITLRNGVTFPSK